MDTKHGTQEAPARKLFTVERIAGLSTQRRHNLQRRLMERCDDAESAEQRPSRWGPRPEDSARVLRARAVLGRFSLLCEQHPAKS